MSKERLEDIEQTINIYCKHKALPVTLNQEDAKWIVKYAKEQAERVQELESEYRVRQTEYLEEHIDRLEKANKRYREALEFYADEDNYKTTGEKTYIGHGDYTEEIWIPVDVDSGKKARQALEGEDQWITF